MARSQPPQQPLPVQRLVVQYTKLGVVQFASHRDFGRALERALRRAEVPMAYSSGFHPHPRISYAGAAPTGAQSKAEYLELALAKVCDPAELAAALSDALPNGFDIVRVQTSPGKALAERLEASCWLMDLPGVEHQVLHRATRALRDADLVEVTRRTKKGDRTFDVRAGIVSITSDSGHAADPNANNVQVVLRHTAPLVRPDDVVKALGQVCPELTVAAGSMRPCRLIQGPLLADGTVGDPLDVE